MEATRLQKDAFCTGCNLKDERVQECILFGGQIFQMRSKYLDGKRYPTRYGYDVIIFFDGTKWRAVPQDGTHERLPLVCADSTDIDATLRHFDASDSTARSRLHVVTRHGRRHLYVGSLGLRGGGEQRLLDVATSSKHTRVPYPETDSTLPSNTTDVVRHHEQSQSVQEINGFRSTSIDFAESQLHESSAEFLRMLKTGYEDGNFFGRKLCSSGLMLTNQKFNLAKIQDIQRLTKTAPVKLGDPVGRAIVDLKTKCAVSDFMTKDDDTSRALVLGLPGVGKSTFGRRLSLDWSRGTWGHRFSTLFLLPFSDLLKRHSGRSVTRETPALSDAIVDTCFSHIDISVRFEQIRHYVRETLKRKTTLLIVDMADEIQNDRSLYCQDIMRQAVSGNHECNVLLLARPNFCPATLNRFQTYELSGFTYEDVEEKCSDQASLHTLLKTHRELLELARTPRNFGIIERECQSTNDINDSRRRLSSMHHVRNVMLQRWHDIEGSADQSSNRLIVDEFDTLGRLALIGLELGCCGIPRSKLDEKHVLNAQSVSMRSGLIIQNASGDFEFMHGISMQFFAGRRLARMLCTDEEQIKGTEDAEVERIVQKMKYKSTFVNVLSAMIKELFTKNTEAVRKLLTMIDAGSVEVLGVQHLKVKMHCLQQLLLEEGNKDRIREIDIEFGITRSLGQWMRIGMKSKQSDMLKATVHLMKTYPQVVSFAGNRLLLKFIKRFQPKSADETTVEVLACIAQYGNIWEQDWLKILRSHLENDADEEGQVLAVRCIGLLGQFEEELIPSLIGLPFANCKEHGLRDRTLIELFRRSPQCGEDFTGRLVEICLNQDYWVRKTMLKSLPEILKGRDGHANSLMNNLLTMIDEDPRHISVGAIEALGVCIEEIAYGINDLFDVLQRNWTRLAEDQLSSAANVLADAIQYMPEKAAEIVEELLKARVDFAWTAVYPTLKTILKVLGDIPVKEADVVVGLLVKNYENGDDPYALALLLTAIQYLKTPVGSLPDPKTVILRAFKHEEWSIRDMAYRVVSAIADRGPKDMMSDVSNAIVVRCTEETVWKAKCGLLAAASELLKADADNDALVAKCIEDLEDDDDVVRVLAGDAVAMGIVHSSNGRTILDEIVRQVDGADDDKRHGIVHCLHSVARDRPEMIHVIAPILINASRSHSKSIASVAVAGLHTVASSDDGSRDALVEALLDACRAEDRVARFCALDALSMCICKDAARAEKLIGGFKDIPEPLNDNEWSIYFRALETAIHVAEVDCQSVIDKLFVDDFETDSHIFEMRSRIIDKISLERLMKWYETMNSNDVAKQISRKAYWMPITIKMDAGQLRKMSVCSEQGREFRIREQLAKRMMNLDGRRKKILWRFKRRLSKIPPGSPLYNTQCN